MTDDELDNIRLGMENVWATAYAAGYTAGVDAVEAEWHKLVGIHDKGLIGPFPLDMKLYYTYPPRSEDDDTTDR